MQELVISDKLAGAPISHQPVQLDKPTQPVHHTESGQPSAGHMDDNLVQKCSKSINVHTKIHHIVTH